MKFNYKVFSNINTNLQKSNDDKGISSKSETINASLDRSGGSERPSSALNKKEAKNEFEKNVPLSTRMDNHEGLYPTRRNKRVFDGTQDTGNMAIYNDKKYRDAFDKKQKNKAKKDENYQLQDSPERYGKSYIPKHEDTQEDIKNIGTKNEIQNMPGFREEQIKEKSDILKQSDLILFNIFLKMASDNRSEPNKQELDVINEISDLKNIILRN